MYNKDMDKFQKFSAALESLCVEHEVALDLEVIDQFIVRIRVFDKLENESNLSAGLDLVDCTNIIVDDFINH